MELRQRQVEGAMVVDLSGDGIGSEPSRLKELLVSLLASGHRHIVLNVEQLHTMDSTCVAEIDASYKAAIATGGVLKMASPNQYVRRLLQTTRVDTFVTTYDSEASAIASFDVAPSRT
jgi:anti-anti-sigma factor